MKRFLVASIALASIAGLAGCQRVGDEHTSTAERAVVKAPAPVRAPASAPAPASDDNGAHTASRDAITDSVITTRIKAGILSDPGMAGSDVSVNTDHGVVSLTGMIKSQEQAAIASAHAQRPDGVMRVDNQLVMNLH